MPFGKYRGWPLANVPAAYLAWAVDIAREPLRTDIEVELYARQGPDADLAQAAGGIDPGAALELVELGRKAAARKHHPDVTGGDAGRLAILNSTADRLLALFGERESRAA
jgi:hypothetical protein